MQKQSNRFYQPNLSQSISSNHHQSQNNNHNAREFTKNFSFGNNLSSTLSNQEFHHNELNSYIQQKHPDSDSVNRLLNQEQKHISEFIQYDENKKLEQLANQRKYINLHLSSYGYSQIGDVVPYNISSIQAIHLTIQSLLQQRQIDLENRKDSFEKNRVLENQRNVLSMQIEKLLNRNQSLEVQRDSAIQQIKAMEKSHSEKEAKLTLEIKETHSQFLKIQSRESQYLHDLRKKDSAYKQLQDQIKKFQSEKNVIYKNAFELTNTLQSKPTLFIDNENLDFSHQISQGLSDMQTKLITENEYLQQTLLNINQVISDSLTQRKQIYVRRKQIELGQDYKQDPDILEFQLINFQKEMYQLPTINLGQEAIEILNENIRRFKEFMNQIDNIKKEMMVEQGIDTTDGEIEQNQCLRSLQNLLQNYQFVVEAQDSLINQSIIKDCNNNNNGQYNDQRDLEERLGRLPSLIDDQDIQSAQNHLLEQQKFLEEKRKDFDNTSQIMLSRQQQFNEQKLIIAQQQEVASREAESFQENLQNLINTTKLISNELGVNNQMEIVN